MKLKVAELTVKIHFKHDQALTVFNNIAVRRKECSSITNDHQRFKFTLYLRRTRSYTSSFIQQLIANDTKKLTRARIYTEVHFGQEAASYHKAIPIGALRFARLQSHLRRLCETGYHYRAR